MPALRFDPLDATETSILTEPALLVLRGAAVFFPTVAFTELVLMTFGAAVPLCFLFNSSTFKLD